MLQLLFGSTQLFRYLFCFDPSDLRDLACRSRGQRLPGVLLTFSARLTKARAGLFLALFFWGGGTASFEIFGLPEALPIHMEPDVRDPVSFK